MLFFSLLNRAALDSILAGSTKANLLLDEDCSAACVRDGLTPKQLCPNANDVEVPGSDRSEVLLPPLAAAQLASPDGALIVLLGVSLREDGVCLRALEASYAASLKTSKTRTKRLAVLSLSESASLHPSVPAAHIPPAVGNLTHTAAALRPRTRHLWGSIDQLLALTASTLDTRRQFNELLAHQRSGISSYHFDVGGSNSTMENPTQKPTESSASGRDDADALGDVLVPMPSPAWTRYRDDKPKDASSAALTHGFEGSAPRISKGWGLAALQGIRTPLSTSSSSISSSKGAQKELPWTHRIPRLPVSSLQPPSPLSSSSSPPLVAPRGPWVAASELYSKQAQSPSGLNGRDSFDSESMTHHPDYDRGILPPPHGTSKSKRKRSTVDQDAFQLRTGVGTEVRYAMTHEPPKSDQQLNWDFAPRHELERRQSHIADAAVQQQRIDDRKREQKKLRALKKKQARATALTKEHQSKRPTNVLSPVSEESSGGYEKGAVQGPRDLSNDPGEGKHDNEGEDLRRGSEDSNEDDGNDDNDDASDNDGDGSDSEDTSSEGTTSQGWSHSSSLGGGVGADDRGKP